MRLRYSPEYYRNDNEVICSLDCSIDYGSSFGRLQSLLDNVPTSFAVRGSAMCSDQDTFNFGFGQRLAFHRALGQAYSKYYYILNYLARAIYYEGTEIGEALDKFNYLMENHRNNKVYLDNLQEETFR